MIHDLNNIIIEEEEIKAVKLTKEEKYGNCEPAGR